MWDGAGVRRRFCFSKRSLSSTSARRTPRRTSSLCSGGVYVKHPPSFHHVITNSGGAERGHVPAGPNAVEPRGRSLVSLQCGGRRGVRTLQDRQEAAEKHPRRFKRSEESTGLFPVCSSTSSSTFNVKTSSDEAPLINNQPSDEHVTSSR